MTTKRTCPPDLICRNTWNHSRIPVIRDFPVGCGLHPVGFGLPKKAQNDQRVGNGCDDAAAASVNLGPSLKKVKLTGYQRPCSAEVGLVETADERSRVGCADGSGEVERSDPRLMKPGCKGLLSAEGNSSQASFVARKGSYSKSLLGKNVNHPHQRFVSATRTFPPFCGSNARRLGRGKTENVEPAGSGNRTLDAECKENRPRTRQNRPPSLSPREKVQETLRLFKAVFRELTLEQRGKREDAADLCRRVDYRTRKVIEKKGKLVNREKVIGEVAGIEIGDEFQYKAELSVVGLHHSMWGGIDYTSRGRVKLATSIVSSGSYNDELEKEVVVYTGQGGNVERRNERAEDQKLVTGNLALSNSFKYKSPVRVIRGEAIAGVRGKLYVYDGLYLVERIWRELGPRGKFVFKFLLRRKTGQPHLP